MNEITLFDFGNSDAFLGSSPKRQPFFIEIDGQRYQNPDCEVMGERFLEMYKKYTYNIKQKKK